MRSDRLHHKFLNPITNPKMKPSPLPIHFKLPGRSYSQIGRKGNVALYSVYSDYFNFNGFTLPYILIGFELIAIKVKNGRECYPTARDFGKCAWAIPKSVSRICSLSSRCCRIVRSAMFGSTSKTAADRSSAPEASAHLALRFA